MSGKTVVGTMASIAIVAVFAVVGLSLVDRLMVVYGPATALRIWLGGGGIAVVIAILGLWWDTFRRRRKRQWQRSCYPSRWWEGVELPPFLQTR